MRLHFGFDDMPCGVRSVVTVGSFDGVHAGHRTLLAHLKSMAQRLDAESVVVTFEPHPRIAMGRAEGMGLLTTIEERALLLVINNHVLRIVDSDREIAPEERGADFEIMGRINPKADSFIDGTACDD